MLALILALMTPGGVAQSRERALFGDAGGRVFSDNSLRRTEVRGRRVQVDLSALVGAGLLGGADSVGLNLFPDVDLTARKSGFERRDDRHFTWYGKVPGDPHSLVILVGGDAIVAGSVFAHGKHYAIRGRDPADQEVFELDQSAFPPEACDQIPAGNQGQPAASFQDPLADTGTVIDVLVVYTPAARSAAGGTAAIQNLITLNVAETNATYTNSGITARLSLAQTAEVAYTESGSMVLDLNRLTTPGDGFMDEVHALRDSSAADVVALFILDSNPSFPNCGQAAAIMATAATAFCVVDQRCGSGSYTFGHEIGHLQGARHNWYTDNRNNSPFTFNHGHIDLLHRLRTVMSYNDQCAATPPGTYCTRVPYWSNPGVLYPGTATPAGSSIENNALTLNTTATTVANFRQPTPWRIVGVGDFNADGTTDILWRETAAGWLYVWYMNGAGVRTGGAYLAPNRVDANWTVAGVGDFNADGKPDILWRETNAGWLYVWYMNGAGSMISGAYLSPNRVDANWTVAAVGDFNADGKPDILWRETNAGWIYLWRMNSAGAMTSGTYLSPNRVDTNWTIAGAGDFNADGKTDILWRETTAGWVYTWYLNGAGVQSGGAYLAPNRVETSWRIAGVGEFDGSVGPDLLWQESGLTPYLWFMSGIALSGATYVQ